MTRPVTLREQMRLRPSGDLLLIVLLGIAVRGWILFSTSLAPGINGAYYLVQARSLLEKGRLGIPDFPLTFFVHAAVAKLFQTLGGIPLETAVLWSTKLTDAIIPPLAAIPVYWLIRGWTSVEDGRRNRWIALGSAAVVAFGAPSLSMAGDFQKNSIGLVFLAGFIFASRRFFTSEEAAQKRFAGAAALALMALMGLTHIGVLGCALVLAAAILSAHLLIRGAAPSWRSMLTLGAAALLLMLVTAAVSWRFDPARVRRLAGAIFNPGQFLSASPPGPPGGPPGMRPPGGTRPPGPPRLPLAALRFIPFALLCGAAGASALTAWRRRGREPGDAAVVIGSAAAAIALTGPWFSMDSSMRLALIAVIPAVAALAYLLNHVRQRWVTVAAGFAPLVLLTGAAVPQVLRGGRAVITTGTYEELKTVRKLLPGQALELERTLVVAGHGLEWWCAWVLHTHIAQAQALRVDDWMRFDRVLFIEAKGGLQFPGPPPPRGPRSGARFPMPMPMPMMGAPIPPGAEIVHEGESLRLALIRTPPDFVAQKRR